MLCNVKCKALSFLLYQKMEEKKIYQDHHIPTTADITRLTPKGSPRFGSLSHHSFFSRHNPHPHRVTHIPGLNGKPVCMVNDDWYMATSLFPHPLIKSQVFRTTTGAPFALPFGHCSHGGKSAKHRAALLSEAWKEELKELAAKVNISSQIKDVMAEQPGEAVVRRKTQYSAQTGRIIPQSSLLYQRRPHPHPLGFTSSLYDQELMVLELLCQILQTDSLSLVQQWLLLAGQREKDMVMQLIQQAMEDSDLSSHQQRLYQGPLQAPRTSMTAQIQGPPQAFLPRTSVTAQIPSRGQLQRKQRLTGSLKTQPPSMEDRPENIGEAEVLEIHRDNPCPPCDEEDGED
ncbi:protein TBATA [Hypomesus transpacificus]|uniref:protein TBATA n=1 Tax=Hypomesus transpacificus TaxID=137520 RepID=UPI001F0869DE|nr:protein TBATA [Hypomesus transpacificus]